MNLSLFAIIGCIAVASAGWKLNVKPLGRNEYYVPRSEVDRIFSSWDEVWKHARIVPFFDNGQVAGMKIFKITPGGVFDRLGFKNDDVITKFDGIVASDVAVALMAVGGYRKASSASIEVKRKGKLMTLKYKSDPPATEATESPATGKSKLRKSK